MKFVLAVALTLSVTTIASAQDYLGSSLQSESFGRQLERSQGNAGVNRPKYRKHHQTAQPSQAQMNEVMRRLKPEYERRVQREGRASANRWLKRTAYRLGQEAGRSARR
ncbi:hypothetical protein [Mesorhizobium sp. BE184]|uniref:hypothetical protein n=1 Tax=Mesorhizobium sp. BE184 TaxID=2817714 RepID=UPI0028552D1C|nr:hypothetical protein [Mesorhizobium sp. BE184]MDR7034997.1 hypothetical protein [Mesorhizobium sp. BE184]